MLTCLRIHELAIVDRLEVRFGGGLNVITGETGAGKSIVVNALKLVLGGRAQADLLRTGADEGEVEALFDGPDGLRDRLAAAGLPPDDQLVVRRLITAGGRSRAFLNGRLVTATQLGAIASGLVDISSQHEHHTLVDPTTHLAWLDAYAGLRTDEMGELHDAVRAAATALADARRRTAERVDREDLVRFQLGEIERIAPRTGEDDELAATVGRLMHAERLATATRAAEEALGSGGPAIGTHLRRLVADLREAARIDPTLSPSTERLEQARVDIDDVARDLSRYTRRTHADPFALAEAEERLAAVRKLIRRHGSIEEALAIAAALRAEAAEMGDIEGRVERCVEGLAQALTRATDAARALSAARTRAASALSGAIEAELATLAMGSARVEVRVAPTPSSDDALSVDGAELGPRGIDRAEFLVAPNRGEDPRPLRRVASGGELSRALLALKRVLASVGPVGTYVFDEVDSGVGGATAAILGRKLGDVALRHQVVCITHLPQVAALATHHLRVEKHEVGGRTISAITRLDDAQRVEEIARMLGGLRVTGATRQAAADLLAGAA